MPTSNASPNGRTGGRRSSWDQKLDHVLRAGARVISREGYGQATIRQVAREANMSLAGLYHYFSSKEDLLFRIQFQTFDSLLQRLRGKLEPIRDPRERLRVMVANHLEYFLARMSELKVCAHELESLSGHYYEQVRSLRQDYLHITLEIVESISREAGGSRIELRLATMYLFGMLNWIYMWYPRADGMPAEILADQLIALFLDGFLPREPSDNQPEKGR
jgi:AcrR family transcriptional regulator